MNPVIGAAIAGGLVTAAVILAGNRLIDAFADGGNGTNISFTPGEMPTCDSAPVRQLLKSAIEQSPLAQQSGLKVTSIGKTRAFELPGFVQGSNGKWLCQAMVFTNGGKLEASFHTEWTNNAKNEIWLEVGALENNPFSSLN